MATTEHTINDALASVLRETRRAWSGSNVVSSENTSILKHSAKRPDILVTEPNVSPVVIETEVVPAANIEADAVSRLGDQIQTTGRTILSSVAVRLPSRLRLKHSNALSRAPTINTVQGPNAIQAVLERYQWIQQGASRLHRSPAGARLFSRR